MHVSRYLEMPHNIRYFDYFISSFVRLLALFSMILSERSFFFEKLIVVATPCGMIFFKNFLEELFFEFMIISFQRPYHALLLYSAKRSFLIAPL